jgi:hypothetical protein
MDILKQKKKKKDLDTSVKKHIFFKKCKLVGRGILPGNSKSLWSAVCIAKYQNFEGFPPKKHSFQMVSKLPKLICAMLSLVFLTLKCNI